MTEEAIIKIVLDEAFHVNRKIGPGMLETWIKHVLHIGHKCEVYYPDTLLELKSLIDRLIPKAQYFLFRTKKIEPDISC